MTRSILTSYTFEILDPNEAFHVAGSLQNQLTQKSVK